jgi:hypothetical protein
MKRFLLDRVAPLEGVICRNPGLHFHRDQDNSSQHANSNYLLTVYPAEPLWWAWISSNQSF